MEHGGQYVMTCSMLIMQKYCAGPWDLIHRK